MNDPGTSGQPLGDHGRVPRRVLLQRAVLGAAVAVVLLGSVAVLWAAFMSGFMVPTWLKVVAVGWLPLFLVLLATIVVVGRAGGPGPAASRPLAYHPQMPRWWMTLLGTGVLLTGLTLVGLCAHVGAPALALGPDPVHVPAERVVQGPPCSKCSRPVWVLFRTNDGTYVWAALAGADGLTENDGRLTELVYDPAAPTHVMRESDWRRGRGGTTVVTGLSGAVVLLGLVGGMIAVIRRRRRIFGQLRPAMTLLTVRSRPVRSGLAWKVGFADRTSTSYLDSQSLRTSLLARLALGLVDISAQDLRRLHESYRRGAR